MAHKKKSHMKSKMAAKVPDTMGAPVKPAMKMKMKAGRGK